MRRKSRGLIFYSLIFLGILAIIGAAQFYETKRSPIPISANKNNTNTKLNKKTASIENDRFAAPEVLGDNKIIDVDPDDASHLKDVINGAAPGDTIRLGDGEYKIEGLKITASGKKSDWIKIVAAHEAKPRINLQGLGDFHVSGSYIYIEGLEIFNGQKTNLRVAASTHTLSFVYLKRLKLRNLQAGTGASLRIQRNNANGVGVSNIFVEDSDLSLSTPNSVIEGIGVNTVVVRNCFIHTDSGFAAGITFKGGSSRVLLENNFIKGVRQNPAIVMGGKTFLNFFDSQYSDQEGVDQIARNNIIVDFDEAAVNFQGIKNAKFLHNTIVTNSAGPIFAFSEGNSNDGAKPSKNQNITIENNLVLSQAPSSTYAKNESGLIPSLKFGKQMWIGAFTNAVNGRLSIPQFPQTSDSLLPSQKLPTALENLQWKDIVDLEMAKARFTPKQNGPVLRSTASLTEVLTDLQGTTRSEPTSFGAIEAVQAAASN